MIQSIETSYLNAIAELESMLKGISAEIVGHKKAPLTGGFTLNQKNAVRSIFNQKHSRLAAIRQDLERKIAAYRQKLAILKEENILENACRAA